MGEWKFTRQNGLNKTDRFEEQEKKETGSKDIFRQIKFSNLSILKKDLKFSHTHGQSDVFANQQIYTYNSSVFE